MTTKFTEPDNARLTGDMYSKKNKVTNTPSTPNINKWEQQINESTNKIISNAKKSVVAQAGSKIFSNIAKTFK